MGAGNMTSNQTCNFLQLIYYSTVSTNRPDIFTNTSSTAKRDHLNLPDCYWQLHTKKLVMSHCHTDVRLLFFAACYQLLEQSVSRNGRCTISKCFQETLGITATEEGLLHGLLVRINLSGCCLCKIRLSFVFVIWWLLPQQPHPVSFW